MAGVNSAGKRKENKLGSQENQTYQLCSIAHNCEDLKGEKSPGDFPLNHLVGGRGESKTWEKKSGGDLC